MGEMELTTTEAILYVALINAAIGLILGLIPLGFGFFLGKKRLGILAIICSTLAGTIFSIYVTFPIIAIFMWLILESKVARLGISSFVTVLGIFLIVFGYIRSNAAGDAGMPMSEAHAFLFQALMIGGAFFTLVGLVLLFFSFLHVSNKNEEETDI